MADSGWLRRYYGSWAAKLNPTVVIDGKYHAVVRVTQVGKVGYLLITKGGAHDISSERILLEGVPTAEDYRLMRAELDRVDGRR